MSTPQARAASPPALSYLDRDEWIAGVLFDLELSPTARMVGASLGLAINREGPCIPLSAIGGHLRVFAKRLGLPTAIIAKACNALVARGWLRLWIGKGGHLRGFDLGQGGQS